jgi:microsomal dipeptidase-like Zn-dependent dipeptidase
MKKLTLSFFLFCLGNTITFAQNDPAKVINVPITRPVTSILKVGLTGWVDMHTHPTSQWGFGEQLFYGENEGDPSKALGSCGCFHNFVVPPFDGSCGQQNMYRNSMVDKIDQENHIGPHAKVAGFPNFDQWPKHNSLLHQQMYVDWIKRAKEGGLRVMVALAVNSNCLADAAETGGPNDDMRSMNTQIKRMKEFFGNRSYSFMQIAYSAAELRAIVSQGKLAVIIGVEMDNIGNFYKPADPKGQSFNPNPNQVQVKSEIDRLYTMGVRYIFPIHITNNVFGGTALYNSGFNVANKYNTGLTFVPEPVDASSGITFKLSSSFSAIRQDFLAGLAMGVTGPVLPNFIMPDVPGNYPNYPDPGYNKGHRNNLGLTQMGMAAIAYMMKKGMMIDIDHMSEKAVTSALALAKLYKYPLNSGHNGFRGYGAYNENSRTDNQVRSIYELGGIMGIGHGDNATNFVNNYRYGIRLTNGASLAIGTDANGFYPLPGPPAANERIDYRPPMTKASMGTKTWDYNTEGVAHYGLMPDYFESCKKVGMSAGEWNAFNSAAERFAQMWEKCTGAAADLNNVSTETEQVFSIASEGMLCPMLTKGDREFAGHGPDVSCTVTLKITPDKTAVDAVITMTASETGGGDTEAKGFWTRRVYTAPGGTKIIRIDGAVFSAARFVSAGAGSEFGSCNEGIVYDSQKGQINITGSVIKSIVMVGDTGGPDVTANPNDCRCDTKISRIDFNPVKVIISPL